jgi:hypothetical protein
MISQLIHCTLDKLSQKIIDFLDKCTLDKLSQKIIDFLDNCTLSIIFIIKNAIF